MGYKGQTIRDEIKILVKPVGHLVVSYEYDTDDKPIILV